MDKQIVEHQQSSGLTGIFSGDNSFQVAIRQSEYLAASDMIPEQYRGKPANILIAISMAERMRSDVMMVMQNLCIVKGNPSWSAQFLIACANTSGRFSELEFEEEEGKVEKIDHVTVYNQKETRKTYTVKNDRCRVYATNLKLNKIVYGPWVSVEMAVKEGWYGKNGSKWQTIPQIMLQYRAAAFFVRTKAPEISMGMLTQDEEIDMGPANVIHENDIAPKSEVVNELKALQKKQETKKKPAAKKTEAVEAATIDEPKAEQQAESVDDIDQLTSIKGFIDLSNTLEALKAVGENIKEMIDDDELTEFEVREAKIYLDAAIKAVKNG